MKIRRIVTTGAIVTASVSSACSFYVLTRSGLAGTLMGAAVAGLVYNLTSQGITHGLDAGRRLVKRPPDASDGADASDSAQADSEPGHATQALRQDVRARSSLKTTLRTWMPAGLGLVALAISVSALVSEPAPAVVTERIVTQPVIQERVVVEERTVTITVPVASSGGQSQGTVPAGPTTSTTSPPDTTVTEQAPAPTTTTTRPAAASTTTTETRPQGPTGTTATN